MKIFSFRHDSGMIGLLLGLGLHLAVCGSSAVMAAPDTWVYFGCVGDAPGIYRSTLDSDTGLIRPAERIVEGNGISFLAFSSDGKRLYAVERVDGKGFASAFSVDATTGDLQRLNQQPIGTRGACHISVTPDGQTVATADYGDGAVAVFSVAEDGSLDAQQLATVFHHKGKSVKPDRQSKSHAHSVTPSLDSRFLYAADLGTDEIVVYALDDSGKVTETEKRKVKNLGGGPRHLVMHPNGDFAYTNLEMTSQITAFARDRQTGRLTERDSISTLPEARPGNSTSELLCHPSGAFLFCANRGHDSIASFRLEEDGSLSSCGHCPCGGEIPRNFGISPDGKWIVTANQKSKNAAVLRVNADSGVLELLPDSRLALPVPMCVRFLTMEK